MVNKGRSLIFMVKQSKASFAGGNRRGDEGDKDSRGGGKGDWGGNYQVQQSAIYYYTYQPQDWHFYTALKTALNNEW